MKFRHLATATLLVSTLGTLSGAACADDAKGCATLVGAASSDTPQGFQLRDGEPVDLVSGEPTGGKPGTPSGGKAVHGKLLVFGENGVFRAYWQPLNSPEKYVLASAGTDTVRLISTPPQGTPATNGEPGTRLAPQRVLSCPAL